MVTPTFTVYVEHNKGAWRKSVTFQTVYRNMSEDRCCCGACHVKTGAWIVAIAQFVFGVVDLVNGIVHLAKMKEGKEYALARFIIGCHIFFTAIWLLLIFLLLIGLHKNNSLLILPHLIVTIIYVVLIVALTICMGLFGTPIIGTIMVLCAVPIIFGLLWIEWRCYKYISAIA